MVHCMCVVCVRVFAFPEVVSDSTLQLSDDKDEDTIYDHEYHTSVSVLGYTLVYI